MSYISHFCTRTKRLKFPFPLISHHLHSSDSKAKNPDQNTYWATIAIAVAGAAFAFFITFAPIVVDAFWPFITAKADSEQEPPLLHDAGMSLLSAATNSDPNPSKGATDIEVTGGTALIANTGPDGTLPPTSGSASAPSSSTYLVREGDSLSEIADMYGVSTNTILWANDITDAKSIQPGDTLTILPVSGVLHTVAKGDTLAGIAAKYDADANEIASYNGSRSLTTGDDIVVPNGTLAPKKKAPGTKVVSSGTATVTKSTKALPVLTGYFSNPVPSAYVSQGVHGHNGIDLAGIAQGTAVYAAAAGTVTVAEGAGDYNGGYGNYVDITHANGTVTRYAHLSSVAVATGQTIAQNEKIGGVGNTGRSTGMHLHFEVRGAKNPFAN